MISKYEKNILPFIKDFDTFINFILEKDPNLSDKKQVLGKNDCFELNSQLNFKKKTDKASYIQEQYITIELMFLLATESKLFLVEINSKNKFKLVKTSQLDEFIKLNIYERYVFLLECFWTKYDFEKKLRYNVQIFYELTYIISKSNLHGKIVNKGIGNSYTLFSSNSIFLNIFRILGLCELDFIDNVKSKYDDSIESVMPTEFGIEICKVLSTKALDYVNFDFDFIKMLKDFFKIKSYKKNKSFFEIILGVFELGLIEKTINNKVEVNKKGDYILKVSLSKSLWRVVKLSYKNTFDDLHMIIQTAFEFDNDHMYAFYTGASHKTGKEFYSADPMGRSDEYDELKIEDSEIYKGQQFIYLFDFGDMWEFKIKVMDFIENEESSLSPQIIESKGDSPQQYPDWD